MITLITVLLLPLSSVFSGFMLSKMWDWFVVPIFSVNQLSITQAIGLMIIVKLFVGVDIDKKMNDVELLQSAIDNFKFSIVVFALAYIVKLFL